MRGLIAFIFVFCIIVVVHEFGHFYFAKRSGILVREFSIGMGPKIFSHIGKDGTAYTVRILPLGGYVRMAGWSDDETDIQTGTPVSLTRNETGQVVRINLSDKPVDVNSIPMNVTHYDLEDKLEITGLVLGEQQTFAVHHDATIVEADGTEVRIAPLDVQYQNATIWGRMMTNFAGPMNNFILGMIAFLLLVFMQGGVADPSTNVVTVADNSAMQAAGVKTGSQILAVNGQAVADYKDISEAIHKVTDQAVSAPTIQFTIEQDGKQRDVAVTAEKRDGYYQVGITAQLKTGFWEQVAGGFAMAGQTALQIVGALRDLIAHFDVNKLGGPVAIYSVSAQAADQGFLSVLNLLAMLSINLGIVNLFPIPALDGGKIVLNLLELIRRKPLKQEVETYVTIAGVLVMLLLMIAVTWNDIMRVFF